MINQVASKYFVSHDKNGQYSCIKQSTSSDFKVLSRDKMSSFTYEIHVIMASQMHINSLNLGLNFKPGFEKF